MSQDSENEDKVKQVENRLDKVDLRNTCPKCGNDKLEVRNYSMMWHDGDLHCCACGEFVRTYDAG